MSEEVFVPLGYWLFILLASKLIMRWLKGTKDKYAKAMIGYACCMLAIPIGFVVIAILTSLYNLIFGGVL